MNAVTPWEWAQMARQQDPRTYNRGGGSFADNPEALGASKAMLQQAGLWNPAWDAYVNYTPDYTDGGNGSYMAPPDLSSLNGYRFDTTRGPEHSEFLQLSGPDGQQVGLEQYENPGSSLRSKDYLKLAAVAAAMTGAGIGLNGGFAGLGGAGAGAGGAAGGGIGTLGTLASGAGALAPIGATGAGTVGSLTAGLGGLAKVGGGLEALAAAGGGLSGLLGSIGGALGGISGNTLANLGQAAIGLYGQKRAIGAMKDATAQSNAFNERAFDTIRAENKPLMDLRNSVLPQIQGLLSNPGSITSDPGYKFQFDEGTKALNNGAAARGMTYSGAQGKALQRYGQDFGASKLDQSLNRLTTVAGLGQVGANSNNAATQNYANNGSNNALNMGNARGSAYAGGAGLVGNALQNYTNQGMQQDIMDRLFGRRP